MKQNISNRLKNVYDRLYIHFVINKKLKDLSKERLLIEKTISNLSSFLMEINMEEIELKQKLDKAQSYKEKLKIVR